MSSSFLFARTTWHQQIWTASSGCYTMCTLCCAHCVRRKGSAQIGSVRIGKFHIGRVHIVCSVFHKLKCKSRARKANRLHSWRAFYCTHIVGVPGAHPELLLHLEPRVDISFFSTLSCSCRSSKFTTLLNHANTAAGIIFTPLELFISGRNFWRSDSCHVMNAVCRSCSAPQASSGRHSCESIQC
jgi:hypothetical protein